MDGAKIREIRRSRSMTQEEFADELGTSRFMVNRWEAGIHRPNIDSTRKIAKVAGITIDELIEEVTE
ncbi:helix-turn-helix transcriptional regulator [Streptomyces sp. NPDC096095]|uniref:helix-turn-helix transcriptional regulator n=1 Tax=Streptomyces sp. NPDC096095 TaxID=3155545 RepID=UPI00331B463E